MEDLLTDIERQKNIYKNPKLFIKYRKLKPCKMFKNSTEADLPCDLFMGSVFFIGQKTIIESYSWVEHECSLTPMMKYIVPAYLNSIEVHAISRHEFDDSFYNWIIRYVKDSNFIIRDRPSELEKFAWALVQNGMSVWILEK